MRFCGFVLAKSKKKRSKNRRRKNVSKWCANLIKSRFTSKKKVFDFFDFFQKNRFLPLPDWAGSNDAEIEK